MELEDAFPHEETGDQVTAIEEVKADLLRPRPMDRLICGDVGFGKTEIAVRAAFKVVMEGKQVAVLVPTTLLAEQHLITFGERYAPFPVKVAMLSRFVSKPEQERVVEDLRRGAIDVVIGTHRLLSADIGFKDLGLVVVDEEQRFGVAHKERLKKLRAQVDVLTMTATPIPRTLEMALAGIRDMSTVDTPPRTGSRCSPTSVSTTRGSRSAPCGASCCARGRCSGSTTASRRSSARPRGCRSRSPTPGSWSRTVRWTRTCSSGG